jgi:hypothetical protein
MAERKTTRTTKKMKAVEPEAIAPPPPPPPPPPPAPAPEPRSFGEWVPIIYEGDIFADADGGVFVRGTRTRLKAKVATRLLNVDGFRLAG